LSVENEPAVALPAPPALSNARDAAVARIVSRLSSEYVLRILQLTIEAFGDIRAGLLAQAINTANTAYFNGHGGGRPAIGANATFPDEARRPISLARLADSVGLPFESTRRIVQRLVDAGTCLRVEGGVIVPVTTVQRPEVVRGVVANLGYVRRLVRDLEAVGFVEGVGPAWKSTADEPPQDTPAARAIARLSAQYLLRALRMLVDTYGNVLDGVIAQTIFSANTAHLDARNGEGRRYAGVDQPAPDEVRRPVSVGRLADSLAMPFETTRRHVQRLTEAGVCIRLQGGLIIPLAVQERPVAVRNAIANLGYIRKFVRDALDVELEVNGGEAR
jgi:DNA-binding Lrp family transcriptional regulator